MSLCDAANPFFLAVITPALFQPYPSAPDEWMFAALMRADGTLKSTMEKHYDTPVPIGNGSQRRTWISLGRIWTRRRSLGVEAFGIVVHHRFPGDGDDGVWFLPFSSVRRRGWESGRRWGLVGEIRANIHANIAVPKAVRQRGRLSDVMARRNNSESKDPTLREILIKRLAAAVPASNTFNKTAGVDRYVCHAGTFSGPEPPGNSKRAENKATKFVELRAAHLSLYQFIHPHVYSANNSDKNQLKDDHFVLAMKAGGTAPEIILNTNHDWVSSVNSVGAPSYVYVQSYRSLGGGLFTSMSCEKLGSPTFLQIPRAHILFSLASFSGIHRQEVNSQLTVVTLCKDSFRLYDAFHCQRNALQLSLKELITLCGT
ncbi:hypothetical protein B0H10DRAFT_1965652 [Mycena sp. CBHHK59/15]|nr:hypothetical protein B0H10DRAFT_1965652 [Mycena sp. CBHHK59/15]